MTTPFEHSFDYRGVVERIDLARVRHAERQRWRSGGEWDRRAPKIAVGDLPDGRWYASCYDLPDEPPACAYEGRHAEHYARATARRWMRTFGGDWAEA
jgi:hypothetical protein